MTFPADTFEEAVDLSITASNQLHTILNGDSTTEVAVEDGSKIPSVRKAYTDSLFFLSPQPWSVGEYETVYNQLRSFVEPIGITTWWFSKTATVSTPILMSTTPHEDSNWTLWNAINNSVYETQKRLAAEAGFNMVGSFLLGATVTNVGDVVFYETGGKYYSWSGAFPKVVPAGSTPSTAGGVGAGAWVDRTDDSLRDELNSDAGFSLVAGKLLESGIKRSLYSTLSDFHVSVLNYGGVVADGVTDCRAGIEQLILACSVLTSGCTIYFPKGKYLLNSYSSDSSLAIAYSQILPLRSNVSLHLDPDAEIIIGSFFDDKHFTAFTGFDDATIANASNTNNVHITGGTISFSGSTSKMRTGYKLRVAINFGKSSGSFVKDVTFKNGDLSNCIVAGNAAIGEYHTVKDCRFINLVQDADSGRSYNDDFTACYCNSLYSKVIDCDFYNASTRGKEIACAVELHKSFSNWTGGTIYGYTRGSYVVATPTESIYTQECVVSGVKGVVTNRLVDLWIVQNCYLNSINVHNNIIRTHSRSGGENALYYGACGIIGSEGGETDVGQSDIILVHDNIFSVDASVPSALSNCITTNKDIYGWKITNNIFSAKHLIWNDTTFTRIYTGLHIKDNIFNHEYMEPSSIFAELKVHHITNCVIDIKMSGYVALTNVLKLQGAIAGSNNLIKVHHDFTDLITTPVNMMDDIYNTATTNHSEFPVTAKFFIPEETGAYPFYTIDSYPYHNKMYLLTKGTFPSNSYPQTDLVKCGPYNQFGGVVYNNGIGGNSFTARAIISNI